MTSVKISSVEQASQLAATQAMLAYGDHTFCVGGLLVASDGTVIHQMHNRVMVDRTLMDPTAHGERQLVDWYYKQLAGGVALPPADTISVVTSLDPCCMCTGAILTAGFRAVTVAEDTTSGINYDSLDNFHTLPVGLRPAAQATFSYPAIVGQSGFARPGRGAPLVFPAGDGTIDEKTAALCEMIFDDTLMKVREDINNDLPPEQLLDIRDLPEDHYVRVALSNADPLALSVDFRKYAPDVRLAAPLAEAMARDQAQGGPGDAVALLDHFGNLMLIRAGDEQSSPIRTAFMECTRAYARLRHELFQLHATDRATYPEDPHLFLAHPKYCTFVAALGPDHGAQSYMVLGAYGSTMEGPVPEQNPMQYQYCVDRISRAEVKDVCAAMPPLYSEIIKIDPDPVADQKLAAAVRDAWERLKA
ncbi:nucleoside deaminase [Sphingomonas sp. CFBP 8760]|uniref:nucleoside deaminase n=1 Tax=Sphingomonas sp. CFBP 8760 TaxID=2775282 RepID=UPI00177C6A54|nr:nucleoside deaminase [Sphingomonas sp. CFBP 8760]MBD8546794.1 nucleoside deaminase [Sphingomonas sp. CFBP 8760]